MKFPFGNVELSLELWNIIPGISGFDDWGGAMKRLGLIIPMAFLVLVLSAVGCGRNVASAPDVDATVAAAVAAAAVSHQTDAPVACQRHWGLHPVAVVTCRSHGQATSLWPLAGQPAALAGPFLA